MKSTIAKKTEGYGYKYTELADINKYCEENGIRYYQEVETCEINQKDYIMTTLYDANTGEETTKHRGCQIVQAVLSGIKNPVQEYGSSLTYCRRYSLLMALGLATEDDDAQSLSVSTIQTKEDALKVKVEFGKYSGKTLEEIIELDEGYIEWLRDNAKQNYIKEAINLIKPLPSEEDQKEWFELHNEMMELVKETHTDPDNMCKAFKVNSTSNMTNEQLRIAIKKLKEKLGE